MKKTWLILPIFCLLCTIGSFFTCISGFVCHAPTKVNIYWSFISVVWIIYWIVIVTLAVKEYRKQNNINE
jgi:fructose-specific phosphotransferase system IIC component